MPKCLGCFTRYQLEKEGVETERYLEPCPHSGEGYFVYYGPAPKTHKDVDRIARVLRTRFKISQPRGRKSNPPDIAKIIAAINKYLPDATLSELAGHLNMRERSLQRALEPFGGFQKIQEGMRRRGKPQMGKKFFKRLRRR